MGPTTREAIKDLPAETAANVCRLQAQADRNGLPLRHEPGVPWSVAAAAHYDWIAKHQKKSRLHDRLFILVGVIAVASLVLHVCN